MSLSTQAAYRLPPREIVDLVDAPDTPDVAVSPDRAWLLLMERPSLPSIAELAQPELRLAGLRLNPRTNGPSRALPYRNLTFLRVEDGSQQDVKGLPPQARILDVAWSPSGRRIAFVVEVEAGLRLWVADRDSAHARRVADVWLNGAFGDAYHWQVDDAGQEALLCKLVPPGRGAPPPPPVVPTGPVIQENAGTVAAAWTFQDLLQNAHDEALFEHFLTSQVARVSLDGGATLLGDPGMYRHAVPSPDARYVLVHRLHRPFSYLVPAERFPMTTELWDAGGRLIRLIANLPLAEDVPTVRNAVRTGPRQLSWRADAPATLAWVEALDQGDPRIETSERDRVFQLAAPFDREPQPLITLGYRLTRVLWGHDTLAIVEEQWWKTRRDRRWLLDPSQAGGAARLWIDRSREDRYHDPGWPLLRSTPAGTRVLLTRRDAAGESLFMAGDGATPEGERPFLDRHSLADGATERLWRSEPPRYEHVVTVLDETAPVILTRAESVDDPPNYFVRDLGTGALRQLTNVPHPALELRGVHKELLRYERADGVQLTGMLYLPPGWQPSHGPLPLLMWAYPTEFKSAAAAGQVRGSPHRFVRAWPGSPLYLLTQGYAILDNPTMPIVGEGAQEPNDTYVEQLVASAKAAVDEVVRRGVADPRRIAVGGHSYGGFMTVNLLAHSDLFSAGIARSGAYNRTLTPFGFQAEERTLWQAPEIYLRMSPFMHAHRLKTPLLLIHGEADNNSGTFPLQSERLYDALKGHGATVRLVMLPHESHGYRARESVLHMLWEMVTWLDQHVRQGPMKNEE